MATPRTIASCVDLHFRFTTPQGQRAENVWQLKYAGGVPTSANLQALATQWWANTGPTWRLMACSNVIPQEVYVVDLDTGHPAATATLPLGTGHQGTRGTDAEPSNAAASVVLRTGTRGRHFRGRKSLSGFDSQDQTQDTWGNQLMTWIAQYLTQALLGIVVGSITFTPAVGSAALHTATILQSILNPNPYVDSQKTRLPGHGR
jgi:hypothetical protein